MTIAAMILGVALFTEAAPERAPVDELRVQITGMT